MPTPKVTCTKCGQSKEIKFYPQSITEFVEVPSGSGNWYGMPTPICSSCTRGRAPGSAPNSRAALAARQVRGLPPPPEDAYFVRRPDSEALRSHGIELRPLFSEEDS